MLSIQNYGSSSEDEGDCSAKDAKQHSNESLLTHLKPVDPELSVGKKMQICAAPIVMPTVRSKFYIYNFLTSKYCVTFDSMLMQLHFCNLNSNTFL